MGGSEFMLPREYYSQIQHMFETHSNASDPKRQEITRYSGRETSPTTIQALLPEEYLLQEKDICVDIRESHISN